VTTVFVAALPFGADTATTIVVATSVDA